MRLDDKWYCFINSHLAAHHGKVLGVGGVLVGGAMTEGKVLGVGGVLVGGAMAECVRSSRILGGCVLDP